VTPTHYKCMYIKTYTV